MGLLYLLFAICTILSEVKSQNDYDVQIIEENPGIFSEEIGKIQSYRKIWHLVTYVDIEPFIQSLNLVKKKIEDLRSLCTESNTTCINVDEIILLNNRFHMVKIHQSQIFGLIETTSEKRRRKKRFVDPTNEFKKKAKELLFGSVDEEYMKLLDRGIHDLENSELLTFSLIANQTKIIKSKFLKVQDVVNDLNDKLNYTYKVLNEQANKLYNDSSKNKFNSQIQTYTALLSRYLSNIEIDTESLINAILFAKRGQLHPRLFKHEHIKDLERTIKKQEPDATIPISLTNPTIAELEKVSKVSIYFWKDKLTYVLDIPLVHKEVYTLYKHFSIPVYQKFTNSNLFAYISPSKPYVALSEDKKKYFSLSEKRLKECKVNNENYICEVQPVYNLNENTVCEIKLLMNESLSNESLHNCDIKVVELVQPTFKNLYRQNSWLYSTPKSVSMNIICRKKTIQTIPMENTKLVELQAQCVIENRTNTNITYMCPGANITTMDLSLTEIPELQSNCAIDNRTETNISVICSSIGDYLVNLEKTGIIQLQPECVGKTESITLHPVQTITGFRNYKIPFNSSMNISRILLETLKPEEFKSLEIFNQKVFKNYKIVNDGDFENSDSLDKIYLIANDLSHRKILSNDLDRLTKATTISFSTVIILIIILIIFLKCKLYRICSNCLKKKEKKDKSDGLTLQIINSQPETKPSQMQIPNAQFISYPGKKESKRSRRKSSTEIHFPNSKNTYINPSFTKDEKR